MPSVAVLADGGCSIERPESFPVPLSHPRKLPDSRQAPLTDLLGIRNVQVSQGDDGGNRLARPLHDEPLARGGLIEHLAELRPDLECRDRSHSAIIGL